jgi:hypothetical protein
VAVALAVAAVAAGCASGAGGDGADAAAVDADRGPGQSTEAGPDAGSGDGDAPTTTATTRATTTTETTPPVVEIEGTVVSAVDGSALAGAVITTGPAIAAAGGGLADAATPVATTGPDGRFTIEVETDQEFLVRLPAWLPVAFSPEPGVDRLVVTLEPVLARGVRISREVAADRQRFDDLLDLVEGTTVNALVFDTKDETGTVLYDTGVEAAARVDAIRPVYRPADLLAAAREQGLYPITRVVTFEDRVWSAADPEAKLAGAWVDAADEANWAYPLGLAEEACRLGFAEIQFDYVRFPAGRTAQAARSLVPATSEARAAVIADFLATARERLAPIGCGVSAAIFGIVMSSEGDEGIGQTVEAVGAEVDAISPMLYPSHYGPGWLGFADPNDHPGPVVADALDDGMPRMPTAAQMRPWIQAFYYNGQQIGAQIAEAEARGAGWLLWNAPGNYRADWLPRAG